MVNVGGRSQLIFSISSLICMGGDFPCDVGSISNL